MTGLLQKVEIACGKKALWLRCIGTAGWPHILCGTGIP